ncbi:MAG: fibronectin type III domain-containing protein [Treponema sp.]|nr:fibronectin type III domain-containing protein [Treponema sp.]
MDYPENSGIIKSPAGGEVSKKVSDVFTVRFEPASDREFIRWMVMDSVTGNEVTDDRYIEFSSLTLPETECTFKKAPEREMMLSLVPVIVERPQILSYTPLFNENGVNKDSSIQVIFDYDLSDDSIYFTDDEVGKLGNTYGVALLPPVNVNGRTRYYGYKKDGKTFFKNISITDNETGENLNDCFSAPRFENPRRLMVSVKKDDSGNVTLPSWTQVLVNLEKGFFYKVDDKPVCMTAGKKWIYQVSNSEDKTIPGVVSTEVKLVTSTGTKTLSELSAVPSSPWASSDIPYDNYRKLLINLKVKDTGSGPSDSFLVNFKRVGTYDDGTKDGSEWKTTTAKEYPSKSLSYQSVMGEYAECSKTLDFSDLNLDDGVYAVTFEVKDKSGNTYVYPEGVKKFYFNIDTTPPHVYYRSVAESGDSEACKPGVGTVYLDWKGYNQWGNGNWVSKDLYKTTIKYKKHSESMYSNIITTEAGVTNKTITGLLEGTEYDFIISPGDYNGNTEPYYWSTKTLYGPPKKPENLRMISKTSTTIKVAWDPPSSGSDFDIYHIYWTWMPNDGKKKFKSNEVRVSKETTEYTLTITGEVDLTNWPWVNVQVSTIKDPGWNEVWCNEGPATLEVTYP